MTRKLEWAGYGIRVNAVAPAQVSTEGFLKLIGNGGDSLAPHARGSLRGEGDF